MNHKCKCCGLPKQKSEILHLQKQMAKDIEIARLLKARLKYAQTTVMKIGFHNKNIPASVYENVTESYDELHRTFHKMEKVNRWLIKQDVL